MSDTTRNPHGTSSGGIFDEAFDDLIAANATFAESFNLQGFDGIAHAGIAIVTCMDSRIAPLGMFGLVPGDAKIMRNAGGRITDHTLEAVVLAVHLLRVERILIIPHTRCAVASNTQAELRGRLSESAGMDASWMSLPAVTDQLATLKADCARVTTHPLVPRRIKVAGFLYDVDTGLVARHV